MGPVEMGGGGGATVCWWVGNCDRILKSLCRYKTVKFAIISYLAAGGGNLYNREFLTCLM